MSNLMEKVDTLQRAHEEFTRTVGIEYNKLVNVQTRLEMKIDRYIDENEKRQRQREEEFRKYQEESKQERIKLNKQMGELSNKFGTLAEDMVVPSLPRVIQEKFAISIDYVYTNRYFKQGGRNKEFDAYAYTEDYAFLNYTVTTLKTAKVDEMAKEIDDFRFFLPQHADKKVIGILAALRIPSNILRYAEKKGYLVLGLGEYQMEVKNQPNFVPKEF
ncbi:MAG: hypothetical protein AAF518_07055 [Spirochaetota bacterium]